MNHGRLFVLIAALLAMVGNARADETLKFREIYHAVAIQSQDVGDVEGHTLFLVRFSGINTFPDGSTGTGYFTALLDYTRGAGPVLVNYNSVTFGDGSVLWLKWSGTSTIRHYSGTLTVIGGKGRYEGAKGDGTFTGTRIVALAAGADAYFDLVINLKK